MAQTEREAKVQRKVMEILRKHGCYVYKNAQSAFTEKGRPDLTACIPVKISVLLKEYGNDAKIGVFTGIELKRDGHLGEVSEAQQIVGRKIINCGGKWFAIDDPDVIEALMLHWEVNK